MRGIGAVNGTVFDTDGQTPLADARVTISASGVQYTDYSDQSGAYHFINVPAGQFTLQVSHPQRVTAASAGGAVAREGDSVTINMTLGPVATVTGKVFMADGATPSAGGGVNLSLSNGRVLTGVTDSSGLFLFSGIAVPCSFSLYVEDAGGAGIARASGSLTDNGQILNLGNMVLDDKAISIVAVDPADSSVNIPVTTKVTILFSEAADPATIHSGNIYLNQGGTRISGSLTLGSDNTLVTFIPSVPLKGLASHIIVVTQGVTDRVGRPLAKAYSGSFTTIDNIAPLITAISPANGTVEISADSVIRVSFNEPVDPASIAGITLSQGGNVVQTRTDLLQGGTVVALTPLAPLELNRTYTVFLSGVTDMFGNLLAGTMQASFNTPRKKEEKGDRFILEEKGKKREKAGKREKGDRFI